MMLCGAGAPARECRQRIILILREVIDESRSSPAAPTLASSAQLSPYAADTSSTNSPRFPISKSSNSNPGATVHPTSAHDFQSATCDANQHPARTTA